MKYYYSKILQTYIDLEPLRISQHVLAAAKKLGIKLNWDDDGNICSITLEEAKWLTEELGGFIMSPVEYWKVYKEAYENGLDEVLDSLTSHYFTEFLDRIYYSRDEYIDHAKALGEHRYEGEIITKEAIPGRPGWILFEDIDVEAGAPFRVRKKGVDDAKLMKYWDADVSVSAVRTCVAIRGYVTSVDNVSLDLGIPVEGRQPKMMIRFCTKNKPESFLLPEEYDTLNKALESDERKQLEEVIDGPIFDKLSKSEDNAEVALREQITSALGYARIRENISGNRLLTYDELLKYVKTSHDKLYKVAAENKKIVFVLGHRNPDSDTVVSSLFEAFRLSSCYGTDDTIYLPLIQAAEMPAEIRALLEDEIADALIYEDKIPLDEWINAGIVRFVFTDQNYQKEYQKYVCAVTDHHAYAQALKEHEPTYSCIVELVGSATSLVVRKLKGNGFEPDRKVAKILYGAMLMDTENRVGHKMTAWDELIMDQIKNKADVDDDDDFYSSLMSHLINEKDWRKLYHRDYKVFQGFDFAELKVVEFLGNPASEATIPELIAEAERNNIEKNIYLTLVKLTQYLPGGRIIDRERVYTIFGSSAQKEVREKVIELLHAVVRLYFPEAVIEQRNDYMEISGVGKQLSRKQLAPALEKLLYHMNRYMYIEKLDRWVSRDFMKLTSSVKAVDDSLSADGKNRICNISFPEVKNLLKKLGLEMLDIRDYWAVYDEVVQKHDYRMLESLTDSTFIEYLDTGAEDGEVIHHPDISEGEDGQLRMTGADRDYDIIPAKPGLISPSEIDKKSGLPAVVHGPGDYENRELWRYWTPPEKGYYVFSRSYIFLLGQVCLDAKMSMHEGFVNLGIRPVRRDNMKINIRIQAEADTLRIYYSGEDEPEELLVYEAAVQIY